MIIYESLKTQLADRNAAVAIPGLSYYPSTATP